MMTNGTETPRKQGRPKGSRTRPAPVVHHQPPPCRNCGRTEVRVLRRVAEHEFAGISPAGEPYTRIEWHRVQCVFCSVVMMRKTYHNDAPSAE